MNHRQHLVESFETNSYTHSRRDGGLSQECPLGGRRHWVIWMNPATAISQPSRRPTMCGRWVAASMPQTPSFFIQRGCLLYNLLAGQRLSLRWGAASATLPVRRSLPPSGAASGILPVGLWDTHSLMRIAASHQLDRFLRVPQNDRICVAAWADVGAHIAAFAATFSDAPNAAFSSISRNRFLQWFVFTSREPASRAGRV